MLDSLFKKSKLGHWLWILATLICVSLVFTVLPANSAPKPNYAARLTANFHLQIEVTSLQLPDEMPGQCLVSGTIVRLFRARIETLDTGDRLDVPVDCTLAVEEETGGDITAVKELQDAQYIEMYVNPRMEAGFELADQQFMVIANPSDQPQCETERAGIMC